MYNKVFNELLKKQKEAIEEIAKEYGLSEAEVVMIAEEVLRKSSQTPAAAFNFLNEFYENYGNKYIRHLNKRKNIVLY